MKINVIEQNQKPEEEEIKEEIKEEDLEEIKFKNKSEEIKVNSIQK